METQVGDPDAQAALLQRGAQRFHQLDRIARQGFRRSDRLWRKRTAHLHQLGRRDRLDQVGGPTMRLVEAADQLWSKTMDEGRPGAGLQFADHVETDLREVLDHAVGQAQGADRQARDGAAAVSAVDDHSGIGDVARKGVGRAPAAAHGGAGIHADLGQAADQVLQVSGLTALQVCSSGRVDHQAVRRVGGDDGRERLQGPKGELLQPVLVAGEVGVLDDQVGGDGLGPGGRVAGIDSESLGGVVGR